MFPTRVNGRHNTLTRRSAQARFAMNRFVGDLILGLRYTTPTTKQLPTTPTANTRA
jgi:hypothetical protein